MIMNILATIFFIIIYGGIFIELLYLMYLQDTFHDSEKSDKYWRKYNEKHKNR